jgi:GST-like protein
MPETNRPRFDFYFARSGNSLRAAIALELCEVPFHKHELDMSQNDQKSEAFLAINPAGRVPALVLTAPDGHTTVLPQSGAIMEHLLRQHRLDLFPEDEGERAICNAIFIAALSDVAIQSALAGYLSMNVQAARFILDRMLSDLRALFEPVKASPYLCGKKVTIADFAHFPVVHMRAPQLRQLTGFAHVLGWYDHMSANPAIVRAVAYAGLQIES